MDKQPLKGLDNFSGSVMYTTPARQFFTDFIVSKYFVLSILLWSCASRNAIFRR